MQKSFFIFICLVIRPTYCSEYKPHKAYILHNTVQNYAWGSKVALAEFLGYSPNQKQPMAELWMGAHPKAPSHIVVGNITSSLLEVIQKQPARLLGGTVAQKFNDTLPFLFKVLAADQPLSLQVHPTIEQAQEGFKAENALSIPLTALHRNYKDANHKPELICALTPFWALNGFRPLKEIAQTVRSIPSPLLHKLSKSFLADPTVESFRAYLSSLFDVPEKQRKTVVAEIVAYCKRHIDQDPAFRWMLIYDDLYPGDISVLLCLFLNLFHLQPGQALFVGAGQIHAYLEGMGIEIMANSDNVLRAGGTVKHVDSAELLRILNFVQKEISSITPRPVSGTEEVYDTIAKDFQLSVITIGEGTPFISSRDRPVEILLCTEGYGMFIDLSDGEGLELTKGISILVPASLAQYKVQGNATLYKASVPLR